jgi:hypothetical protein
MKYGVALAAALLLTGCATTPPPPRFTVDVPKQRALELNDVYVYSFLDLWDDDLGQAFLTHFKAWLTLNLNQHGVRHTQLLFRDMRSSQEAPVLAWEGSSYKVAVGGIVERNQLAEEAFGARYRLVIFPTKATSHTETTRYGGRSEPYFTYKILWHLMDATTGEVVWSATSQDTVGHVKGGSERSGQLALLLVNGFIEQLRSQGLIEARQAPASGAERPASGR